MATADGSRADLATMTAMVDEFHRRSAHRESVIDRLHEENQELRRGLWRAALDPVVTDLLRLYDGLSRQARRSDTGAATADLLASFAEDVELTLDRCGLTIFTALPGDAFSPALHLVVGFTPCDASAQNNTVAEVVSKGLQERDTSRVRRPVRVRVHRYTAPVAADATPMSEPPPAEEPPSEAAPSARPVNEQAAVGEPANESTSIGDPGLHGTTSSGESGGHR